MQFKIFQSIGRFRQRAEIPAIVVEHVSRESGTNRGLASKSRPEDMLSLVRAHVYDPHYPAYI